MPARASQPATPSARAYAAQLYKRHSEGLLSFFRASLPLTKGDAMDLLQRTFEELLKWLDRNPNGTIEHPQAFLYAIAHRLLGRHRDKQRRVPDLPQGPEPELDARAHEDDLAYMTSQHEIQRQALRAMRRMDDLDSQVILYLRFWQGLTEEGIGQVLGRSRSTIAGQLRRAKQALIAKLAELEQADPGKTRTSTTLLARWWQRVEAQANGAEPEPPSTTDQSDDDGAPDQAKPR
jgi:RNA polymerase sigma factor (sigma-70 family)